MLRRTWIVTICWPRRRSKAGTYSGTRRTAIGASLTLGSAKERLGNAAALSVSEQSNRKTPSSRIGSKTIAPAAPYPSEPFPWSIVGLSDRPPLQIQLQLQLQPELEHSTMLLLLDPHLQRFPPTRSNFLAKTSRREDGTHLVEERDEDEAMQPSAVFLFTNDKMAR